MGYCMNTRESNFRIKKENFDKALLAIKTLDPSQGSGYSRSHSHFAWVEESEYKSAETLSQALDSWRWSAGISDSGDIDSIDFCGEKLGDDEILFQAIAPFVNDSYYWKKTGKFSWNKILRVVEDPKGPLWLNGDSSYYGENDRVSERNLSTLTSSLCLIRPIDLKIIVTSEGKEFGPPRRRVRARFNLCGEEYYLVVTDPLVEHYYLARKDGENSITEALLSISLTEVYNGYAYKLAASVITPKRIGE